MDFNLRELFRGIDEMAQEFETIFNNIQIIDDPGMFQNRQRSFLRPREMMLKNPKTIQNQLGGDNESSQLIQQGPHGSLRPKSASPSGFFSSSFESSQMHFNEDGTSTIRIKSVKDGKTVEKEIIKKGDKVISEREIVSPRDHNPGGGNGSWRFW